MQNDSVRIYQMLKEQLQRGYPELLDDDDALLGTLEGMSDVHEIIAGLIRDAQRAAAMANGIAEIMKDNAARKSRLEVRSDRLRGVALSMMQDCGIPKITAPDLTISVSSGVPRVIITNDDCVPDALCVITRAPKKSEIAKLLKSGEFVPYATLSNAPQVLKVTAR